MSGQVISGDNLREASNTRDYIPVVSTVTGLKDIWVKVYMVFVEVFPGHPASGPFNGVSEQEVSRLRYFHLVDQKSVFRCLIMLVPIIGNVILFLFDSVNRREESEDRKSLLRKIKLNSHEFLRVDERLRNDGEFVLAALEMNQGVVPFISEGLIRKDEFMRSFVFRFPQMVSLIGENGEFFLRLMRVCGVAVLKNAGEELRSNKEKLTPVLMEFPRALEYASDEITNDGELICSILLSQKRIGVQGCGWYRFAGKELRSDPNFAKWALDNLDQDSLEDFFQYSTPGIRKDKVLMMRAIERNPCCYDFVGKEIEYDREIVLSAVRNRGRLLIDRDDLRDRFDEDAEIARAAVISHPDALRFLPDEFQRSDDDIAYIIEGIRGRAYGPESSDDEEGSPRESDIRHVKEIHRSAVARSEAKGGVHGGE